MLRIDVFLKAQIYGYYNNVESLNVLFLSKGKFFIFLQQLTCIRLCHLLTKRIKNVA